MGEKYPPRAGSSGPALKRPQVQPVKAKATTPLKGSAPRARKGPPRSSALRLCRLAPLYALAHALLQGTGIPLPLHLLPPTGVGQGQGVAQLKATA